MSLIELTNGHGCAVISSHAGAALRSFRVVVEGTEYELLTGGSDGDLDAASTPSGKGSFIMAPWVNRIHNGLLVTEQGEFHLPVDSSVHAIHGTVRNREWNILSVTDDYAQLRIDLEEPWPFRGHVLYTVMLDGSSLVQTLSVEAANGERSFPAGVGWHPWFRRSLGAGELLLKVDARHQWELDEQTIPSGRFGETDAVRKLKSGGQFAVGELDDCFMLGGSREAELVWPELKLRISGSPEITHAMVYSPEGSICVEPQTSTVNAFQLAAKGIDATGTRVVAQGSPLEATTRWSWHSV